MKLDELGAQYALAARALRERLKQVEGELERAGDETEELRLRYRLRLLRSMYRDTRAAALYLEHYYDHRKRRDEP